jgi:hypothetical protein
VWIVRGVRPEHPDVEIQYLEGEGGERWDRRPGETEQALIGRASKEAKRNEWGVARLLANT